MSVALTEALIVSTQIAWIRSFASDGYPELNLALLEPIIVLNLPGRTFVSLDAKLAYNFVDHSGLPLIKGGVGLYIDRRKSLAISAWYQRSLSNASFSASEPGSLGFNFEVGAAIGYFFDW
jgi:hypothetical protein